MLFESTYVENLKRLKIKVIIGYISFEEGSSTLVSEIEKIAKKSKLSTDKIKFYRENYEYQENQYEDRLIFYYEREETKEEFEKRFEQLELKDIRTFLNVLAQFHSHVKGKSVIQRVFEKTLKKYKGLVPYWEVGLVEQFFSTKSKEELIQEAYQKGLKEGEKSSREKLKKICEVTKQLKKIYYL